MLQSSQFDGLSFDPFALKQGGLAASEVDVGGRQVLKALVVALVIVVFDEATDVRFAAQPTEPGPFSCGSGGLEDS